TDIQPGTFEDRLSFEFVELRRYRILIRHRLRPELRIVLRPTAFSRLRETGHAADGISPSPQSQVVDTARSGRRAIPWLSMTAPRSLRELFDQIGLHEVLSSDGSVVMEMPVDERVVNTAGGLQG